MSAPSFTGSETGRGRRGDRNRVGSALFRPSFRPLKTTMSGSREAQLLLENHALARTSMTDYLVVSVGSEQSRSVLVFIDPNCMAWQRGAGKILYFRPGARDLPKLVRSEHAPRRRKRLPMGPPHRRRHPERLSSPTGGLDGDEKMMKASSFCIQSVVIRLSSFLHPTGT